jgi:thioredoxin 1
MSFVSHYSDDEPAREEVDRMAGPVVVEFGADWCPYCQALQPGLVDLFERYPQVKHIKVADGKGKPLGRSFRVKLWPSLVFLRDGEPVRQMARPSTEDVREGFAAVTGQGSAGSDLPS